MSGLIACISAFFSAFSQHRDLALENLALSQQLAIFKRRHPRPRLRPTDRLFWVWLSKIWAGWREALIIVKPETVIAWHRQVFRFYWRWLARRKSIGRPTVSAEVRMLIKQMAQANPLWGAPRGSKVSVPQSAPVTVPPGAEAPPQPVDQPQGPARLTVEQVMEKWNGWLLWFAIADLLTSVVAFGVCALMWEWDKNRNGIPDHIEQWLIAQNYLAQQTAPSLAQNAVAVAPAAPVAAPQPCPCGNKVPWNA